jgi:hypothetical protein
MTLSGIEPATFQFVAQCPSQLRHRVPRRVSIWLTNLEFLLLKQTTNCFAKVISHKISFRTESFLQTHRYCFLNIFYAQKFPLKTSTGLRDFFLDCLTLADGTDRSPRNVGKYQFTVRYIPEQRRPLSTGFLTTS